MSKVLELVERVEMKLEIRRSKESAPYVRGYNYSLFNEGMRITSHFCSEDGFAHSDLYKHTKTKEVIGKMSLDEFYKTPIIKE